MGNNKNGIIYRNTANLKNNKGTVKSQKWKNEKDKFKKIKKCIN